jgi:short-subunit dehydrogenase
VGRLPFRSALVTGASSGIGDAFVRLLAADGVPTVVVARRADRLLALQAELPGIEVLVADLTTEAGRASVVDRVGRRGAPLDLVVNNAGFGTSGSFVDLDPSRLSREVALNVDALVRISHAALGPMTDRGRGWLLNVSSVAGFQAAPGLAVYGATKSFVTTFSEAIHEEVRPRGVVVTALCPGLTRTEFQAISSSGARSARFPAFAWMTAEAVARRALRDCARGRAVSIPGGLNRALVIASTGLPRSVVRRSSGRIGRSARSQSHN